MANVKTPRFRASYPALIKPKKNDQNGKMEYSVVALFKKGEDLSVLKKAAEDVLLEKFGADKAKWPKNIKSPFRDQEEKEKDGVLPDGHEAGAIFMTFKTTNRPGVVNQKVEPIDDESEFYPGCYAQATVRAFYYGDKPEHKGNKGISFGLQNVQKVADGEPLGGSRVSASAEFEPVAGAEPTASNDDMWS